MGDVLPMKDKNIMIDKKIYIPFGLEIEAENIPFDEGKRVLRHKIDEHWIIGDDRSLDNGGIELSSPLIPNTKDAFIQLKKIASTLEHLNATYTHASLQINLDAYQFTCNDILYLLKLFSIYENIIYCFSTGEDDYIRISAGSNASPLARLFKSEYEENIINSYRPFINNKLFALSLKTKTQSKDDPIKVIEFRTPNGTSNFNLWMNYIVFFSAFLKCIEKNNFDKKYIDYLFRREKFMKTFDDYIAIDEIGANELANLIYQDEVEKDYFYSQYFEKKIKSR